MNKNSMIVYMEKIGFKPIEEFNVLDSYDNKVKCIMFVGDLGHIEIQYNTYYKTYGCIYLPKGFNYVNNWQYGTNNKIGVVAIKSWISQNLYTMFNDQSLYFKYKDIK